MKNQKGLLLFIVIIVSSIVFAFTKLDHKKEPNTSVTEEISCPDSLVVIWTSADKEVATKMVYMYTYNAKKNAWWDDITFIVWGPSSKLLAEDKELQEYTKKMMDAGVNVQACIACASQYGVADSLKAMGIEVKGMGVPLTEYLKSNKKVISF